MNGVTINLVITVDEHTVSPVVSIGAWYNSGHNYEKPTPPTSLLGHRNALAAYKKVLDFAEDIQDD